MNHNQTAATHSIDLPFANVDYTGSWYDTLDQGLHEAEYFKAIIAVAIPNHTGVSGHETPLYRLFGTHKLLERYLRDVYLDDADDDEIEDYINSIHEVVFQP